MLPAKIITDELTATVFYIGKIKYAPGTFGSLAAFYIFLFPFYTIWYLSLFFASLFFLISYNPVKRYELANGDDHSSIVIDEVIGMLIAFSNPYLIISPFWIILSFVIFRIFDILKPFPISKINDRKGAFFVIFDDVIAGVFTLVIVQIIQAGYNILPFFISFFNIF